MSLRHDPKVISQVNQSPYSKCKMKQCCHAYNVLLLACEGEPFCDIQGKLRHNGRRTTPSTPAPTSQRIWAGFQTKSFPSPTNIVLVLRPCKEPCWIVLCHPTHGLNRHAGHLCSTLREMQAWPSCFVGHLAA